MSYRVFRDLLPGGLKVVTVQAPRLRTAMLSAYVRVGSRHESEQNSGVSHFLEHMFFRGSRRFPDTVKMNARVEAAGGNLNGITTRDHGYYFTPLHPEHLGVGLEVLGDMLTRPLLRQMEIEREIILEEMLDEVDERGQDIDLDNLSKMELFGAHPLAFKIAGTRGSVRRLTRRQLKAHYEKYYVRSNMVIAAAGRVQRQEIVDRVAKAFRHLPEGPATLEAPPPPPKKGPWFSFVEHGEAQTEFRLCFPAVPEAHPDFPALQLLRRVLDDGLSSRLPFNVVEKRGLAYSLHAGIEPFADTGLFEIDGASAPKKASAVVAEVLRTLGELCDGLVGEAELARVKRRHRMFLDFAQDSSADLAGWFGGTELFRRAESFEERCKQVEAQSARRLREVARRTFRKENLGVVAVGQALAVRTLERVVQRAEGLPTSP